MLKLLTHSRTFRLLMAILLSLFIQVAGLGVMYATPNGLSMEALITIVSMHLYYVNYWVLTFQVIVNYVLLKPS